MGEDRSMRNQSPKGRTEVYRPSPAAFLTPDGSYLADLAARFGIPAKASAEFLSDLRRRAFVVEAARMDGYTDEEVVRFLSPARPFFLPGSTPPHAFPIHTFLIPSLREENIA